MDAPFIDPMNASLREIRMVIERLVQWKGVEPGMIFSVTDCGLYSAALGLSGFEGLEAQLDKLSAAPGAMPVIIDGEDTLVVDARGRHAWLIAEAVLDLAIDGHRRGGSYGGDLLPYDRRRAYRSLAPAGAGLQGDGGDHLCGQLVGSGQARLAAHPQQWADRRHAALAACGVGAGVL